MSVLDFGELRSLLQAPPTGPSFDKLSAALLDAARADDPEARALFWAQQWPYALDVATRRWPSYLRQAPEALAQDWLRGQSLESLPLFGVVSFYHPNVLRARLGKPKHLERLLHHPEIQALRDWSFFNYQLDAPRLEVISAATDARFDALTMHNCQFDAPGYEQLLSSPATRSLFRLRLERAWLADDLVRVLTRRPHPQLYILSLPSNRLTARSIERLCSWESPAPLTLLNLHNNPLGSLPETNTAWPEALDALFQAPLTASLNHLNLQRVGLGSALRWPEQAPSLRRLTSLTIGDEPLGARCLDTLSQSHALPRLRELSACDVGFDDASLARFLEGSALQNITKLTLGPDLITARSIDALARLGFLSRLRELQLSGCPLQDQGAERLAAQEAALPLTQLTLRRCQLTEQGALALLASPALSSLRSLDLRHNLIKDKASLVALAQERKLSLQL